ncbi:MAG: tetratricopeptide repeat protein [bacterium]|nr:tetratricopeptide repeat protein [bacterium]
MQNSARLLWFHSFLLAGLTCLLAGCGDSVPSTEIASAQEAFDQAQERMSADDTAAALPLLDQAIAGVGLDAEQYGTAVLWRAQCHAESGNLEQAEADLAEAEQGPVDEALLFFTRGVVFTAQGNEAEARKAFAQARKLDPSLKTPR